MKKKKEENWNKFIGGEIDYLILLKFWLDSRNEVTAYFMVLLRISPVGKNECCVSERYYT